MMTTSERRYSTQQAADLLGYSRAWVARLCTKHNIGQVAEGPYHPRLLSEDDIAILRGILMENLSRMKRH